jgi:hypothetical protein
MRELSDAFMDTLISGFLLPLRQRVIQDKDLDLQIRENYINIYFKGNSLLKLIEATGNRFRPEIHPKFLAGLAVPDFFDEDTIREFLGHIPAIKESIILLGASSLEVEYEQLFIRANNNEPRNNSEYFIVDRQLTMPGRDRIDLSAIYWKRDGRKRGQAVPPCFMELKFALNTDIQEVHNQLERYHSAVSERAEQVALETETVFRQKLDLGLFDQPSDRVKAMKTLRVTRNPDEFRYVLVLVDYNPYSKLFDTDRLRDLPFADRLSIFRGGFAMWQKQLATAI